MGKVQKVQNPHSVQKSQKVQKAQSAQSVQKLQKIAKSTKRSNGTICTNCTLCTLDRRISKLELYQKYLLDRRFSKILKLQNKNISKNKIKNSVPWVFKKSHNKLVQERIGYLKNERQKG